MGYSIGLEDIKQPVTLTKCLVAEFLGTMFLVIIGCGTASVTSSDYTTKARNYRVKDVNSRARYSVAGFAGFWLRCDVNSLLHRTH